MNKLESELTRLYLLPGQEWPSLESDTGNSAIKLLSAEGLVRCLVVSLENGGNWEQVAALYQGVQEDLDLPALAISVSGEEGYQIWFSLTDPVPLQLARDFMAGLCRKYLAEIKTAKLKLRPGMEQELSLVPWVPARLENADRWSAYIDPTMGGMFVEETWLEMPPSLDKQAGILARLDSIKAQDFQRALGALQPLAEISVAAPEHGPLAANGDPFPSRPSGNGAALNIGSGFADPKSFLLAVMNDPNASTDQRIAAAVALLPYFEKVPGNKQC